MNNKRKVLTLFLALVLMFTSFSEVLAMGGVNIRDYYSLEGSNLELTIFEEFESPTQNISEIIRKNYQYEVGNKFLRVSTTYNNRLFFNENIDGDWLITLNLNNATEEPIVFKSEKTGKFYAFLFSKKSFENKAKNIYNSPYSIYSIKNNMLEYLTYEDYYKGYITVTSDGFNKSDYPKPKLEIIQQPEYKGNRDVFSFNNMSDSEIEKFGGTLKTDYDSDIKVNYNYRELDLIFNNFSYEEIIKNDAHMDQILVATQSDNLTSKQQKYILDFAKKLALRVSNGSANNKEILMFNYMKSSVGNLGSGKVASENLGERKVNSILRKLNFTEGELLGTFPNIFERVDEASKQNLKFPTGDKKFENIVYSINPLNYKNLTESEKALIPLDVREKISNYLADMGDYLDPEYIDDVNDLSEKIIDNMDENQNDQWETPGYDENIFDNMNPGYDNNYDPDLDNFWDDPEQNNNDDPETNQEVVEEEVKPNRKEKEKWKLEIGKIDGKEALDSVVETTIDNLILHTYSEFAMSVYDINNKQVNPKELQVFTRAPKPIVAAKFIPAQKTNNLYLYVSAFFGLILVAIISSIFFGRYLKNSNIRNSIKEDIKFDVSELKAVDLTGIELKINSVGVDKR